VIAIDLSNFVDGCMFTV